MHYDDKIDDYLNTLSVDEMKAVFFRTRQRLPFMDAPEATVRGGVTYCPQCDREGVHLIDVDASVRLNPLSVETYVDDDETVLGRNLADNENHDLVYLCDEGNHVVKIDPTIDIIGD